MSPQIMRELDRRRTSEPRLVVPGGLKVFRVSVLKESDSYHLLEPVQVHGMETIIFNNYYYHLITHWRFL